MMNAFRRVSSLHAPPRPVQQAAVGDCLPFDPFPFDQNGPAPPEVDVGGHQVADSLMIAPPRMPSHPRCAILSRKHSAPRRAEASRRLLMASEGAGAVEIGRAHV